MAKRDKQANVCNKASVHTPGVHTPEHQWQAQKRRNRYEKELFPSFYPDESLNQHQPIYFSKITEMFCAWYGGWPLATENVATGPKTWLTKY